MHLGLIKLTQIPLRGATQLLGVRCIFEMGSKINYKKTRLLFTKNIKISGCIFSTFIFFQLLATAVESFGSDCDFSHLAFEVPLIGIQSADITKKMKKNPETWQSFEKALPGVKKVFISKDPPCMVLLGWSKPWDNFNKHSREEVKAYLSAIWGKSDLTVNGQGKSRSFSFSENDPLTRYTTETYLSNGKSIKNIAVDIVATQSCVVSMQITGDTGELREQDWQNFAEQFEMVRKLIKVRYGPVQFSSGGRGIGWGSLGKQLLWMIFIAASAFCISRMYLKKFTLTPSSTTRRYSIYIIAIVAIVVAAAVWLKVQRGSPVDFRNTHIPHFALLFIVHLWALVTNKPNIVSFALWIVVVSLFSTAVSWVVGWSAFTINGAIGVFIGASLVAYTIVKSSAPKGAETHHDKQPSAY